MEHLMEYAHLLFLSETWLKSNNAMFKEYGYNLRHNIRRNRAIALGGGVGSLVKTCIEVKPIKFAKFCRTISFYRLDYEPNTLLFEEFTEMLETLAATKNIIIAITKHNITNDCHTIQMNDILSRFNLIQDFLTHSNTFNNWIRRDEYSFPADCRTLKSYYKTIVQSVKQVNKKTSQKRIGRHNTQHSNGCLPGKSCN